MQHLVGDLWALDALGFAVVVPVNVGWKRNGENVMGRGVAAQAASRFPNLPKWFGGMCRTYRQDTGVVATALFDDAGKRHVVICFPVKPLAPDPAFSYMQRASLSLIERSAWQLAGLLNSADFDGVRVALPLVGCGNGGLSRADVLPLLNHILRSDSIYLVEVAGTVDDVPAPDDAGDAEWLEIPPD